MIHSRQSQLSLFARTGPKGARRLEHGSELGKGKRKQARPMDPKRAVHLVLRSSCAKGSWSLLSPKHRFKIEDMVESAAKGFGVRVYRFSNSGNHLHLLIKASDRRAFQGFLRVLSGRIAMLVTQARKGSAFRDHSGRCRRFWDHLAYSRVVEWGRDFKRVSDYVILNLLEGLTVRTRKQGYDLWQATPEGLRTRLQP